MSSAPKTIGRPKKVVSSDTDMADAPMMQRIAFQATAPQRTVLDKEAARLGITVPELLRRIIDSWRKDLGV